MKNVKNNTLNANATPSASSAQVAAKAAFKATKSGNGLRVSTNTKAGKANMNGAAWENFINQQ